MGSSEGFKEDEARVELLSGLQAVIVYGYAGSFWFALKING